LVRGFFQMRRRMEKYDVWRSITCKRKGNKETQSPDKGVG